MYRPDIVPTPLSLLRSDEDDPNIPLDVRPCAKLLTALKGKDLLLKISMICANII